MGDEVLTVQEVAERLRVASRTVYAMLNDREMPGFKVRGQWRVRRSDFYSWLDNAVSGGPAATRAGADEPLPEQEMAALEELQREEIGLPRITERKSQTELHQLVVDLLGDKVISHSSLEQKPLELDLRPPLPSRVRLYLFNATRPPGGRPTGEHKIQLILPGQQRADRGNFDNSDGRIVLLAGYASEDKVFVFWDANLYQNFAWSRNVQVKAPTIISASAGKLATQLRQLRLKSGPAVETVVAAPSSDLSEAIQKRVDLTRERMMQG